MNNQISMFELLDADDTLSAEQQKLRRAIRRGTGFEQGMTRVMKKAKEEPSIKDFADFLKKEYGYGGGTFEDGFVMASPKGFEISSKNWTKEKSYSWTEMAKEIMDMIKTNQYYKE